MNRLVPAPAFRKGKQLASVRLVLTAGSKATSHGAGTSEKENLHCGLGNQPFGRFRLLLPLAFPGGGIP